MKNPTHAFRETNLVFQLIYQKLKIKLWWVEALERKKCIFSNVYFAVRNFCRVCILMYRQVNKLSQYASFYISKILLHALSKAFSVSLRPEESFWNWIIFTPNSIKSFYSCSYQSVFQKNVCAGYLFYAKELRKKVK